MAETLKGVRVIDFTQVLSGPYCAAQLALLGADVVKVEQRDGGDQSRVMMTPTGGFAAHAESPMYVSVNPGKRGMTLDLKHPDAASIVHRLVQGADVLVQNFKAGTMDRMGFGWEAMSALNPRLVYCSISGYGQSGPRAPDAAYDPTIQAASGMMSITGHPDTGPVKTGFWATDMAAGMTAAFAVAAALYRREKTGLGDHIDLSMLDTAVSFVSPILSNYMHAGVVPGLMANASATGNPSSDLFLTADGWLLMAAATEGHFRAVCREIGRPELIEDPRFADRMIRFGNGADMKAILREEFMKDTARNWERRIASAGVPAAVVSSIPGILDDAQIRHRDLIRTIPAQPEIGEDEHYVNSPFKLARDQPGADRPAPLLGEHTDEVLAEIGFSADEIAGFRARGAV